MLFSDRITKDTPPPFTPPNTTFGYTPNSEYSIVSWYQSVYRGFANYYLMAHDVSWKVSKLKWVMTMSLLKTLAAKRRSSCREVAREIKRDVLTPEGPIRAYQVRVQGKRT